MKHHLGFIRQYISMNILHENRPGNETVVKEIRHLGGSVMDVYTGSLTPEEICQEIMENLKTVNSIEKNLFSEWVGKADKDFKVISISDSSQWMLKYFDHEIRYIHLFPARYSPHSFRIKANSLKSAILYQIFIGKDLVTENDLNKARWFAGLSPLKDVVDAEAISEMIEILRG